jgi:hypothetical protein
LTIKEILPAIGAYSSAIDVVRIPGPYRVEAFWLEIQCGFESRGVVKT